MNSERKAFEEEFIKINHDISFWGKTWDESVNDYRHISASLGWHMWCASAQRQGYKLVPVDKLIEKWEKEAKYREDIASEDWVSNTINECIDDLKAMIGAFSNEE